MTTIKKSTVLIQHPHPYIYVEEPDDAAEVEFAGRYGFNVTIKTTPAKTRGGRPEVWVTVTGADDRNTILGEIVSDIPKADDRH